MLISFKNEERNIKEDIKIFAYLKDEVKDTEVKNLQKKIESDNAVKETQFVSKDDALERVKEKYDEDPKQILGDYNPLPASIEIMLNAEMMNTDSISAYQQKLEAFPQIALTKVNAEVVEGMSSFFRIITFVGAGLGILFLAIAIIIIDKTIRLSMYSNRFVIRSMQLVGATRSFITSPYVKRSIINGIVSAAIAICLLLIVVFIIQRNYNYWDLTNTYLKTGFAATFSVLILIGIFITWFSTRSSVHKYIRMKLDELY